MIAAWRLAGVREQRFAVPCDLLFFFRVAWHVQRPGVLYQLGVLGQVGNGAVVLVFDHAATVHAQEPGRKTWCTLSCDGSKRTRSRAGDLARDQKHMARELHPQGPRRERRESKRPARAGHTAADPARPQLHRSCKAQGGRPHDRLKYPAQGTGPDHARRARGSRAARDHCKQGRRTKVEGARVRARPARDARREAARLRCLSSTRHRLTCCGAYPRPQPCSLSTPTRSRTLSRTPSP